MHWKLRLLLWFHHRFNERDLEEISPSQLRRIADNRNYWFFDYKPIPVRTILNRTIPGRQGQQIPVRIYFPKASSKTKEETLPVIVYFHGGGFVIGSLDAYDKVCRRLCDMNQAIVVSVDYRLAPEHKFPAAPNDCYDATCWVAENIAEMGGDVTRLVVMGDSAGGNLATVVAQKVRDAGGPAIAFQVLVYPTTDARMGFPSVTSNGKGYLLTKELMNWFQNHYQRSEADLVNPAMSPLLAEDLSGLPPALIQTAEFDPLRDEGHAYAEALKAAGNSVIYTEYKGLIHTYFTMPRFLKSCMESYVEINRVLKEVFDKKKVTPWTNTYVKVLTTCASFYYLYNP